MTEQNEYNRKLAAVYARVSSANQENEGTIETQLSAVREFAREKNISIIYTYQDNGWSGDNIVRPELDKLRVDAKKKLWQTVIIYDPDRLARRYSYQELICDELREAGIEVLFVTTPSPTNGIEKILYGVQGLFAEYERAKITERFRIGKVRKAKEGNIIASEAPYGYTFIPKKGKKGEPGFHHGYYVVNEAESENVKLIFSLVANDNLTIRGIIKKLQELSIAPRKSKRGVWSTSTLSTLLRNKTYIGEGHFGSSYAVIPQRPLKNTGYRKVKKSSRKMKPEEEWIKIPTPVLIEKDIFDVVQQKLKQNFEQSRRNTKNEYLLAGKIWCTCGRRRAGEGVYKGKHLYYRCTSRVYSFPLPSECMEKGINARNTDAVVWERIVDLFSNPKDLHQRILQWAQIRARESSSVEPARLNFEKELSKLKEQHRRLTEALGEDLITMEEYKEHVLPVRERIANLEQKITHSNERKETTEVFKIPSEATIKTFAKNASEYLKSASLDFSLKKKIISGIVEKVIATPKYLKANGYIPINLIDHVAFSSEYRYDANTTRHAEVSENPLNAMPFEFEIKLPSSSKPIIQLTVESAA